MKLSTARMWSAGGRQSNNRFDTTQTAEGKEARQAKMWMTDEMDLPRTITLLSFESGRMQSQVGPKCSRLLQKRVYAMHQDIIAKFRQTAPIRTE